MDSNVDNTFCKRNYETKNFSGEVTNKSLYVGLT